MRRLLVAIAILLASVAPAFSQCVEADAELIASGIETIQSGQLKGQVLQGKQAAAFAVEAGIEANVVAVFLVEWEGHQQLVVAFNELACFVKPTPKGIALFRKHYGAGV